MIQTAAWSKSARIDVRNAAETVTAARLVVVHAGCGLRTRHFRCGARPGTDPGTRAAGAIAAPDGPVPGARARGRRVPHCGGDSSGLSAQTDRPRERLGCGLPARRHGGRDWVGALAG